VADYAVEHLDEGQDGLKTLVAAFKRCPSL